MAVTAVLKNREHGVTASPSPPHVPVLRAGTAHAFLRGRSWLTPLTSESILGCETKPTRLEILIALRAGRVVQAVSQGETEILRELAPDS